MRQNREIVALTGLRGVAAVFVAMYHFGRHITDPKLHWALHKGYLSVDIFFVLSGFVMATTYHHLFSQKISLRNYGYFLWLRIARIWPLYLLAVVMAWVLLVAAGASPPAGTLAANLFMVQGWGIGPSINPPMWSVSVEFVAYLLFPWLFAVIAKSPRGGLFLIAVLCVVGVAIAANIGAHNGAGRMGLLDLYDPQTALPVIRCVMGFSLGVLVWRLSRFERLSNIVSNSRFGLACVAILLVLFAVNANDLLIYVFFPVLVLSIARDEGIVARFLGARAIHFLGILSFAIYAMQSPYYDLGEPQIAKWTAAMPAGVSTVAYYLGAAAGLLALAIAAHFLVEKPCRLLLRALTQTRRIPAAA
jgi:peptidoglycan/LPS O-acetylase OafA/YrhL